jgi:Ca2+/Na+ antiporter
MEQLINNILSNPTYIVISIVILILLILFLIKKAFKFVIYVIILYVGFLLYIHYTGGDVKEIIDKSKTEVKKYMNT